MESDSLQQTRNLLKLLERITFAGIWTLAACGLALAMRRG